MKNVEDVYPLSPLQESLLLHVLSMPGSGVGFEQKSYTFSGELDEEAFARTWQSLVDRNPLLRTAFLSEGLERPLQIVHRRVSLPLELLDWRSLSEEERALRFEELLATDRARSFDPARAPLMRVTLVRATASSWYFIWTYHHLLLDAWCRTLVLREMFSLYDAYRQDQEPILPRTRPYRDYISWLSRQDPVAAETFWRDSLEGLEAQPPLRIGAPSAPRPDQARSYGERRSEISRSAAEHLEGFARSCRVTLGTLMQGAWALLLERYSGQRDVVFGVTVSGRPAELPGVESMLGMFINNLPMRIRIPQGTTASKWLPQIQERAAEMRRYEHASPAQIQEWSGFPPGRRLFESLLLYQNTPTLGDISEEMSSRRLSASSYRFRLETNYPLTLSAALGGALYLWIYFDERRFDSGTAALVLGHLEALLNGMAEMPSRPVDDLPLLNEAERQQILRTSQEPPLTEDSPVLESLVSSWAYSTPDAPAIRRGEEVVTYFELWNHSAELARRIALLSGTRERGFICAAALETSPAGMTLLLAALRAGGVLVASGIDGRKPAWLPDSRPVIELSGADGPLLQDACPENATLSPPQPWDGALLALPGNSAEAATWIELSHGALAATLAGAAARLGVRPGSGVSLNASMGDHATLLTCLLPWAAGACLVLPETSENTTGVELGNCILLHPGHPVVLRAPGPLVFCQGTLPGLGLLKACGGTLHHLTGLAEAGTWITGGVLPDSPPDFGHPLPGASLHLLDCDLRPVPTGIIGEVCLGGEILIGDFPGRPALAAERLVPDPSAPRPGARMLRTGTLARRGPDGSLEPLGALQHRAGARSSDLGEIEAALRRRHEVLEWALRVSQPAAGRKELLVFIVPAGSHPDLRQELSALLALCAPPSISRVTVRLVPELHRAPDGEIDWETLAESTEDGSGQAQPTQVEDILAGIWASLLGIESVAVDANLFELGAHSLLATQLASRVRQVFQVDLPLRSLFERPTVAGQAARIERALQSGKGLNEPPIVPVSRDGQLPLSFAQERLWFVYQLDPTSFAFNIPRAVLIRGALDVSALEAAFRGVAARHESLRTTFPASEGRAIQKISPEPPLRLCVSDLSGLPADLVEPEARRLASREARRSFDLATGPLIRVHLVKLGTHHHLAVFVLHHIISDAWSMGVLVREVVTLYEAFHSGLPSPLIPLPVQYADFAHWQRQWLEAGALQSQLTYWTEKLAGAPEALNLQTDFPRPEIQTFRGAFHPFALPPELSRAIHQIGREEGVTLFMTLLAGFSILLSRYSGQEDIVVGTDIANRNRLESEGMIGFFVNNLVLRTDLSGNPTFRELLRRVREVTLGAYTHQDLPFDRLVKELRPRRSLSQTPLFQVLFVLQNVPSSSQRFSDLELAPFELDFGMSKFDLALFMTERRGGLVGSWHYSTDLFRAETIARATKHLASLLENALAQPDARLNEIEMWTPEERETRERMRRERESSALGKLRSIRNRRATGQSTESSGVEELA